MDDSIRELSKESQKVQRSFWDILLESIILNLDIRGKVIQDTDNNNEIISGLGNIIDPEIRSGQGRSFLTWYVDALQNISDLNGNYFKKVSKEYEQKLIDDELGKLLSLLGINGNKIKSGSYLDNLIDFSSVYNKVQGNLIGNIITNQPIDIQGNKDYILGTNPKEKGQSKTEPAVQVNRSGGAIEGAISQKTFDSFQTFDRTISSSVAGALNLNYAIYQGGLIKTSRAFCIERNNRVFSRAEIEKFGTKDDQFGGYENKSIGYFLGKSDPYNPFISLGGYNCRHMLDFVSNELAEILLKDQK